MRLPPRWEDQINWHCSGIGRADQGFVRYSCEVEVNGAIYTGTGMTTREALDELRDSVVKCQCSLKEPLYQHQDNP